MSKKKKSPKQSTTYKKNKKEILAWVRSHSTLVSDYSRWYAGMTNKSNDRRLSHNSKMPNGTPYWLKLYCGSRAIAESLETYLHEIGFLETDKKGGIDNNSTYVYVFKKYPTILDGDLDE